MGCGGGGEITLASEREAPVVFGAAWLEACCAQLPWSGRGLMALFRKPGHHNACEERVLLVCKHKVTGAERCDWWPSVEEAEASDWKVLEVRERIKTEKPEWKGLWSVLGLALGRSGTQDKYVRNRSLDQKEFFEVVDDDARRQRPAKKR